MRLYGRLREIRGSVLHFSADLKQNLDQADAVADSIKNTIDKFIDSAGISAPVEPRYQPIWQPAADAKYLLEQIEALRDDKPPRNGFAAHDRLG